MPVPALIAVSAENYRFNSDLLAKMVKELSPEEWLSRPNNKSNHITWIVGHMTWSRREVLFRLGAQWSRPWLDSFTIGARCDSNADYPSPGALMDAWRDVSALLASAFESVSEDVLSQPCPKGPPTPDGKTSGAVKYLAIHETYHMGQVSFLRGWLGHNGIIDLSPQKRWLELGTWA